jgi:hypothetical protein
MKYYSHRTKKVIKKFVYQRHWWECHVMAKWGSLFYDFRCYYILSLRLMKGSILQNLSIYSNGLA